ncbi:unnamed protein product [Leptidea sinapis]|uniref:Uncharacterized protein n=1 Tax=Leptidea sinapis TaxID=189913 RepID=A0A5E4PLX1_9NEOP|nr:unnamed protein product [Leptidea sinapis]
MNSNENTFSQSFVNFLQASVKLDDLEKMTADLDKELADSQNMMHEVQALYNSIPNVQQRQMPDDSHVRNENLDQFLVSTTPVLRLPDMPVQTGDVENIVATMKIYAEELRKSTVTCSSNKSLTKRNIDNIDFTHYSLSLKQLSNTLSIKVNTTSNRDVNLEEKLGSLIENVNMFTQMVEANSKVRETNETWKDNLPESTLQYDNIILKILSDINEATYLLKN